MSVLDLGYDLLLLLLALLRLLLLLLVLLLHILVQLPGGDALGLVLVDGLDLVGNEYVLLLGFCPK